MRGYALAVERFGRMPWRELVTPAIALARAGLPIDWFTTIKAAAAAADLRRYDGEPARSGCRMICRRCVRPKPTVRTLPLGRLADTLERLARGRPG